MSDSAVVIQAFAQTEDEAIIPPKEKPLDQSKAVCSIEREG
jgi:hypothetical protein